LKLLEEFKIVGELKLLDEFKLSTNWTFTGTWMKYHQCIKWTKYFKKKNKNFLPPSHCIAIVNDNWRSDWIILGNFSLYPQTLSHTLIQQQKKLKKKKITERFENYKMYLPRTLRNITFLLFAFFSSGFLFFCLFRFYKLI